MHIEVHVFKLQFTIHISQILHVLYMHAIYFPWSELVQDKFINKLHVIFVMLLWYLKGEGSSPHVVQGICSQIQSSQVSKSALPPIVQD